MGVPKRVLHKGTTDGTKTDEFFEKFQTVFDPLPSFSESYIANISENHAQIALFKGPKSAK